MPVCRCLALTASLLLAAGLARADLTIPGADGSDGSLHVTADTVIDLSQAPTAAWDTASTDVGSNGSNAGNGVYDPDKWAVVFKYASVTVDADATLTFDNHPSRAPVVWLVSGDVTIDGTVDVGGVDGAVAPGLAEPGPGGFRGGMGYSAGGAASGSGLGPGGGPVSGDSGYGGSYGAPAHSGSESYGNSSLVPLVGGSGGGGDGDRSSGGGGGAGALFIASGATVILNGSIVANGGDRGFFSGNAYYYQPGGGSGGGLRVVSRELAGNGTMEALGGSSYNVDHDGSVGRIRLEYVTDTSSLLVTPSPSVVPLTDGSTALIWPPTSAPSAKILSIGGETVGDDPRASFGTYGADVAIPDTESTQVIVETINVEEAAEVYVRVTPRSNAAHQFIPAALDTVISNDPLVVHWTANIPVDVGYSAIQAKVIRP
jgi:hypothetical protein